MNLFDYVTAKGKSAEAFKNGVVDINKVSSDYEELQRIIDAAKIAQASLVPTLLDEKVNVLFPMYSDKVVFVEGKEKTAIDTETVQRFVTPTAFAKMATVSEKSLRDTFKLMEGKGFSEKADVIIAKSKKVIGHAKDTVKVAKMTKAEIEENAK